MEPTQPPVEAGPQQQEELEAIGRLVRLTGAAAVVAAMLLRDQITGRPNPWSELFRATRLHPLASAKELAVHNHAVGLRFTVDRLPDRAPRTRPGLAPGEAGIRELNGG